MKRGTNMNLLPSRRENSPLALQDDFEELFKSFAEPYFNGFRNRIPSTFQARSFPPVNVSETEQQYTVSVELPGMEPKDIDIEVMGNQLNISGERKWEEEKKGKEYHRVESQYGSFARSLTLPDNLRLDRESIDATFQKGVLEITFPKVEPTPIAKIAIKAK
jgi:HSP20 family protein